MTLTNRIWGENNWGKCGESIRNNTNESIKIHNAMAWLGFFFEVRAE